MATDTVVSSVAVKAATGGLENEVKFGVNSENAYHKSEGGLTYKVSDMLNWVESYVSSNRLVFQGAKDPKANGVNTGNIGIFIDTSTSAVLQAE